MPHVIVKLRPGKTNEQKQALADAITAQFIEVLDYNLDAVSIGFEEVSAERWAEDVYRPDIAAKPENLLKKPGYSM